MKRASWLLAALVVVGAVGEGRSEAPPKPSAKVKERLGDKTIEALNGATRVEVFRIEDSKRAKAGDKNQIAGHRILATGKEQGAPFASQLAAMLQTDQALLGSQARCFLPGVAFRAWKDTESVEVLVCFTCKNLQVILRDAKGAEVKKSSGGFGPTYGPLLPLVKTAFPDDKEIQSIKDKK
jgi:hypothetical protein